MLKTAKCSGCGACYNICPQHAIEMKEDIYGFKYPSIDKTLCTDCGLCEKICNTNDFNNIKNPACYAFMADDKTRSKSASGGVFPSLANYFINNGGYVCGAVWDKELNDKQEKGGTPSKLSRDWSVKHIVSNRPDDIEKMRSSKYLQSDTGNCYKEIKSLLDKNIKVLFTGTPCQVNGLKSFLRKDYANLYCVDLICHGVPSAGMFKKYLAENFKNVEYINFREKSRTGWGLDFKIKENNKVRYLENSEYYKMFLNDVILRESCYSCEYNKLPRQGDITMGDFWRITKYSKKLDDKLGTSVITVNNSKGEKLLKILKNNSKLCKKVPLKYALRGNPNLYRPSIPHKNREDFLKRFDKMTFKENYQYTLEDKCDCMVINFWFTGNYGACLTAYGVICLLQKLGLNAKTINYVSADQVRKFKDGFSEKFGEKYLNLTNPVENYEDFLDLNKNCKTFIAGSDQIWSDLVTYSHHCKATQSIYYLDFAAPDAKKITYATSFGVAECKNSAKDKIIFKHFVKQFDAISVRESSGKDIMKNEFGIDTTQLIDGAFNIPMSKLTEMTDLYPPSGEKYAAYYCLPYYKSDKSKEDDIAHRISEKLNLPLKKVPYDKTIPVEKWLSIIKNAEFVISDSYHAVIFSIIFNKPFVQIMRAKAQARFDSLFDLLEMENNSIGRFEKELDFEKIFVKRDWEKINKIIEKEVKRAEVWMKQALDAPVKDKSSYAMTNFLISKSLVDEGTAGICSNKARILSKYFYYKLLSKIFPGKKRSYYKYKSMLYRPYYKVIKQNAKSVDNLKY